MEATGGLEARKRQATRWSSTYNMLERYIKLYPHFNSMSLEEDAMRTIPSPYEHGLIEQFFALMKDFNDAMIFLQYQDPKKVCE